MARKQVFDYKWLGLVIFLTGILFLSLFLCIKIDLLAEIFTYILFVGFILAVIFIVPSLIILSILKSILDKFIFENNQKDFRNSLLILIISFILVTPFFDILHYARNKFLDESFIVIFLPWAVFIIMWLTLIYLFSRIFHVKTPAFWKKTISPLLLALFVLILFSPFLIIMRYNIVNSGYFCFLSPEQKVMDSCRYIKTIGVLKEDRDDKNTENNKANFLEHLTNKMR